MKYCLSCLTNQVVLSPSVWREWIEIYKKTERNDKNGVSLRLEGVDLNETLNEEIEVQLMYPSVWREWIEIV